MSLKAVHVFFITCSVLLSFLVGAWGLRQYLADGGTSGLAIGVFFYLVGFALVAYGLRFLRKIKELGI